MIPARCHFVWLGPRFPWLNALAAVSAAVAGGFERVTLHVDSDLVGQPHFAALGKLSCFEARPVDLARLAQQAGESVSRVRAQFDNMTSAAARSDILRALILAVEGGVYLDMDTVTLASFDGLRTRASFVGKEAICFPEWSARRHSPAEIARAYGLSAMRGALRFWPDGHRLFAKVAHLYDLAVNNAVVGTEPEGVFIRTYLERILAMPFPAARRRYAVGPELLAQVCREVHDVELLAPSFFYPLGPVISERWWSHVAAPDLAGIVTKDTISVHWYASVRNRRKAERVDADYVRRHQHSQLFSHMASRYLPFI